MKLCRVCNSNWILALSVATALLFACQSSEKSSSDGEKQAPSKTAEVKKVEEEAPPPPPPPEEEADEDEAGDEDAATEEEGTGEKASSEAAAPSEEKAEAGDKAEAKPKTTASTKTTKKETTTRVSPRDSKTEPSHDTRTSPRDSKEHHTAASSSKHEKVGSDRCKGCHKNQYVSWESSKHAKQKVDCETCHGPGKDYVPYPIMTNSAKAKAAGLIMPTRDSCKKCHAGGMSAEKFNKVHAHKK